MEDHLLTLANLVALVKVKEKQLRGLDSEIESKLDRIETLREEHNVLRGLVNKTEQELKSAEKKLKEYQEIIAGVSGFSDKAFLVDNRIYSDAPAIQSLTESESVKLSGYAVFEKEKLVKFVRPSSQMIFNSEEEFLTAAKVNEWLIRRYRNLSQQEKQKIFPTIKDELDQMEIEDDIRLAQARLKQKNGELEKNQIEINQLNERIELLIGKKEVKK